jgi:hypothetical protein
MTTPLNVVRPAGIRRGRTLRASLAAVLAGVALAVAGCEEAVAPLPREGVPDALRFSMSGYGMGSSGVELRGDTVVYRRVPWDGDGPPTVDSVRVVPTAEAWRAFWDAVDEAGVRRWRLRYTSDAIDGVGWTLSLEAEGRRVLSSGSNAFPDRRGRQIVDGPTPDFDAFADAVGALVGRDF